MTDCIFCKIINKEIPAKIIAENENAIAFLDIEPCSDGHTLVVPKKHYKNFSSTPKEVLADVMSLAKDVVAIIERTSLHPYGYNYLSNEGDVAGQFVFHFHLHIIPKYGKNEGFTVAYVNKQLLPTQEVYEKIKKVL
ncbi:MAG: HIT family protein [Mycoplasmataceae bacterium]|jgi:histidine triad (HIT) family protein|nr:HIT family protein [Mycoplasmataceae bacterium]